MGIHGAAMAITLDLTEETELLMSALDCFRSGDLILANTYVNWAQSNYERTGKSAEDFGRLLLELTYEMGRNGLSNGLIEPLWRRASMIMVNTMTGCAEVFVMAVRVHLLQGDLTTALRLYDYVALMLNMGQPADAPFLDYFGACERKVQEAIAAKIAELDASY